MTEYINCITEKNNQPTGIAFITCNNGKLALLGDLKFNQEFELQDIKDCDALIRYLVKWRQNKVNELKL